MENVQFGCARVRDQSYRPIIENNRPIIENFLRQHVITHKTLRALRTRCSNLHNQLIKNRLTVARAISDGEMDRELRHMMKRSTPALEKYWGSLMNRKEILRGSLLIIRTGRSD
ncbi:hypothetical protein CCACVL1_05642 [Corchorus capsularis]|uniref:Uncharacterized protein n=1 Tax=Corchorus capsularis TaxID=210143 RepID=A0A1R3JJR3_COCAP|nr:hypothetical protein CCACVL1_05642 [Corchorus capsularis]